MRLTHYDEHKKRWQINDDYGAVMIDGLNYAVGEAIDKLSVYEDAEEQGRLVILPCKVGHYRPKPVTNADRIRAMTDEELAKLFSDWVTDCDCNDVPCRDFCLPNRFDCKMNWLDWLEQEAAP